jgi:hypothetical protein
MLNQRDLVMAVLTRLLHGSRRPSVEAQQARRQGLFLVDSARLLLAPGVVIEGTGLEDLFSGRVYALNDLGRSIAAELGKGITFKALIDMITQKYGISEEEVRRDLQRFLSVLHAQQLLSIRQSYLAELARRSHMGLSQLLRLPGRARYLGKHSPYRRYPATAWSILMGSLRAHQPTAAIGLMLAIATQPLVFLPLLRQGSLPSLPMALYATVPLIAYAGLLVASIVLHELLHYWTARQLGIPLKSVYVGPGRIGITQLNEGSLKNGIVSAAGPGGTVLVLLGLALLFPQLPRGFPVAGISASVMCIAVAIVHSLGLTPLTSDGKQFWRLISFAEMQRV